MLNLPDMVAKPTYTMPGRDLVAVDVSYPSDQQLIDEASACSVICPVAPGLATLPDAAQRLVAHLERVRRRVATLHYARQSGVFYERGVFEPRRELATAGRYLLSGFAEWSGDDAEPLVLVVALVPDVCLSATIRLTLEVDRPSPR